MKENIYRTHNCAELRIGDEGKEVRLAGFVDAIRKLGQITFVTLRDHYGITQLLIKDDNLLLGITKESTISISGKVVERQSKNPKMETGDIEVEVEKITLLGKCDSILPFEISDAPNTKEDLRLKYRFLDLRNKELHDRIVKRAEILRFVRNRMSDKGFVEVQTPILTSSSPEGARDFIVPTVLAKGEFYALPQAPQQYKQLLMVSGFDKYYQIAPCFRNEAARADRTPGEFYQIDFEMSFATQEDVFEVAEDISYSIYEKFTDFDISKPPYRQIKYTDAIRDYCSDKPDLRNPLIVKDYTEFFAEVDFNAFKGKVVKGIVANCGDKSRKFYDELSNVIVANEGKGVAWLKLSDGNFVGSISKFITDQKKAELINLSGIKDGESICFVADTKTKVLNLANVLRNTMGEKLDLIDKNKVVFCWIVDFPFYEFNEEENKIDFSHNPFSMPQGGLDSLLNKKPLDIVAYQYDLVCNGYEMLSGAVRNHDQNVMVKAFEIAGYTRETVETK
ncbi:MAG: aspartate--tRNA ligase, partial [Christensenellales bacterium]